VARRSDLARWFAAGLAAIVVIAGGVAILGGGETRHHLFVTVPDATDAIAGQDIRAAGQNIGSIASIEPVARGRAVKLDLAISDAAWPLPLGTRFALRWGGTISYGNRYIDVIKGPAAAPPLADGQTIPPTDFATPVEFDQLIGTFTPTVRTRVKAFLDNAGTAFGVAEPDLRGAIEQAPPALGQAGAVLGDLDANERALATLVASGDDVAAAVRTANPGIGQLVTGAAATFDAVGSEATALQQTLDTAPSTLSAARVTLGHAQRTLSAAGGLLERLAPGVAQLRALSGPLDDTLGTLVAVGPDAVQTLRTARAATPAVNPLLTQVTGLSPTLGSIGRQAVTQLGCIRPYTPDIVAFFSNWADWLSYSDGRDRYGLANGEVLLPAPYNAVTETSGQVAKQFPGLEYGFPRPPGANAGQPWFLPRCGAGPDALNAADDPEARAYNPLESLSATGRQP
jgi:ABC-type transporter Mla subunit MlaD